MNTVKCYIGTSKIPNAGLGLFAGEKIFKGQTVWANSDCSEIIYTEEQFALLPKQFKENVKKYIYKCGGKYHLNLDDSRHYNHSDNANTTETSDGNYIATMDIESGDELTCNYREFNDDTEWLGEVLSLAVTAKNEK